MDQERLLRLLSYEPDTGTFRWKEKPARRIAIGAVAGSVNDFGGWYYVVIKVEKKSYLAHRLAWFYVTGTWPLFEVDHKDGDGLNNRWTNLRLATRRQNAQNTRAHRDNQSGFVGVSRFRQRWRAEIQVQGAKRHLGLFDTPELASAAYQAAKAKHHAF